MKWMIAGLVWGMCWSCFSAEDYRLFTDKEGRTVEAKVVKFDSRSGKVTLEKRNHRKVAVQASLFSETDQTYIKEWLSVRDFLSSSKFRISVVKKKGKMPTGSSQVKIAKSPSHYEVSLIPSSGTSFGALQIEYCMYLNKDRNKGEDTLSIVSVRIDEIQLVAGKKHIEKTKVVELFKYYSATSFRATSINGGTYIDYTYNKIAEDDLKGIRVRVFLTTSSGKVFMREICEPNSVEKKYEWKEF